MVIFHAIVLVGAELLLIAGAPKVLFNKPMPWIPQVWVRPLGVAEILIGLAFIVAQNQYTAVIVGATYVAFSVLLVRGIIENEADCGCFGTEPVPPNFAHLAVCLSVVAGAVAIAFDGIASVSVPAHIVAVFIGAVCAVCIAEMLTTGTSLNEVVANMSNERSS